MMTLRRSVLAERADWFYVARDRLSVVWSAASLLLAAGWVIARRPDVALVTQLWIVVFGVGLLGVLHGGLDHLVGERVFQRRLQRYWWIYFSLGYVGLAIAVMLTWWLSAPLMLLLFLAVSILHFGLRDDIHAHRRMNAFARFAAVCGLGGAPIIIPWMMFPQQVSLLFGWLAGTRAEAWQPAPSMTNALDSISRLALFPLFPLFPFFLFAGAVVLMVYFKSRRLSDTFSWCEFLATVTLFWTLPPLLAFAWYFCFLHSPLHLLTLAERLAPSQKWAALGWVTLHGLPLTIITLIAGAAAYMWLRHTSLNEAESITRVIFWGLAALTFPHMLLTWLWHRGDETAH